MAVQLQQLDGADLAKQPISILFGGDIRKTQFTASPRTALATGGVRNDFHHLSKVWFGQPGRRNGLLQMPHQSKACAAGSRPNLEAGAAPQPKRAYTTGRTGEDEVSQLRRQWVALDRSSMGGRPHSVSPAPSTFQLLILPRELWIFLPDRIHHDRCWHDSSLVAGRVGGVAFVGRSRRILCGGMDI